MPFPLELKPEEKDYYRKFQFQSWSEEIAADLMALEGNNLIQGPASAWLAGRMFDESIRQLGLAREPQKRRRLRCRRQTRRLGDSRSAVQALILTIRNASLTAQYQEFLDRWHQTPASRPDPKWGQPAPGRGHEDCRGDMANTAQLIAMLESAKTPLFATAPTPEEEDVFLFNLDLIGSFTRKSKSPAVICRNISGFESGNRLDNGNSGLQD